jgi:hypothetical protein
VTPSHSRHVPPRPPRQSWAVPVPGPGPSPARRGRAGAAVHRVRIGLGRPIRPHSWGERDVVRQRRAGPDRAGLIPSRRPWRWADIRIPRFPKSQNPNLEIQISRSKPKSRDPNLVIQTSRSKSRVSEPLVPRITPLRGCLDSMSMQSRCADC